MTLGTLVRATALGAVTIVLAACSSHVDVGFTIEGGLQINNDAGDGSRSSGAAVGDAGAALEAACALTSVCNDAGVCRPTITYASWCNDVCRNATDICDNDCVDKSTDPNNCGRCRQRCSSFETCMMGDCRR